VRRTVLRAAATACLGAICSIGAASAQQQAVEQELRTTHGDWEIHCVKGTDTCAMQQIGETAEGQRAMLVTIQRLAGVQAEGQDVPAAITVSTPIGILIPYGVRVRIDDGNVAPVPLLRCLPESCAARAPLAQQAIDMFKKGSKATVGFYLQNEVLIDISLNGFTAAYNDLKPVQAQGQEPGQN
jgi:invasion protein IalB